METKLPIKVLGVPVVHTIVDEDGRMGIRFDTMITINNENDMELLHGFIVMGVQVINFWGKKMHGLLPKGWAHVRVSKNSEMIIDDKGRPRIGIDKKGTTNLLRRFDFIINHLGWEQTGTDRKEIMVVQITDCGQVISTIPLDQDVIEDVLKNDANGDQEVLLEYAKEAVGIYLGEHFPDWQNPLAYWEE